MRNILGCSMGLLLLACGGSASGDDSEGSCSISAGTYTQHFVTEPGGTSCPSIPDQTLTVASNQTVTGGGGSGPAERAPGCTSNLDSSTCTSSTSCTNTAGGLTTTISLAVTYNGASSSGKETMKSIDSTGKVLSNCTYDITMTKN